MVIDIELQWKYSEFFQLFVDLKSIMGQAGTDTAGELAQFAQNLVAGEGEGILDLDAGVVFRIGVGLEYVSEEKKINPYIRGTTGLFITMDIDGSLAYEIQAGPFSGSIEADIKVTSADDDAMPLSLTVGLDETKNYYLGDPGVTSSARPGFVTIPSIANLANELEVAFDGQVTAGIDAGLSLIGLSARVDVQILDLDALFRGNNVSSVLRVSASITSGGGFSPPTLLDILLSDPQGLLDTLTTSLSTLEDATLGPSGIVSNFPVPFLRKGLGRTLGAGSDRNILAQGRRRIVPGLQEGLASFEGEPSTAAELLGDLLEIAVGSVGLLQRDRNVVVDCFFFDADATATTTVECTSENPKPDSLMWSVPFGQSVVVEMPLDFSLEASTFPLEIEFGGDNSADVPTLELGWSIDLAFGFDQNDGFFLFTVSQIEEKRE